MMPETLIETHCHLDMLKISVDDALRHAQGKISKVMTIAIDPKSIEFVDETTQKYQQVYGALGIHPHEAGQYSPEVENVIRNKIPRNPKIKALGEMGLDYHYSFSEVAVQKKTFSQQLLLAKELDMPVVLHTREAEKDTMEIIQSVLPPKCGVAHSFTSSRQMASELLDLGWYIGINGIVTFKNAHELREVVQYIPLDRMLLETDAPYLTPVPLRGRPNEPAYLEYVAEFVAQEKQVSLEELTTQTSQNAHCLFGFADTMQPPTDDSL